MTNKELQEFLKQYPDDWPVVVDRDAYQALLTVSHDHDDETENFIVLY